MQVGDIHTALSITNSEFTVKLLGKKQIAGTDTVLPEISGRAFICGSSQLAVDPEDPYPLGVCLSDMWGKRIAK